MNRYELDPDQQFSVLLRNIPSIITEASMRVGVIRGGKHDDVLNGFFRAEYDKLAFDYWLAYGCLDVNFHYNRFGVMTTVWECRLLSREQSFAINFATCRVTEAFNSAIHLMMPGIVQRNNYCDCESPYHNPPNHAVICYPAGDKWFCDSCLHSIDLHGDELYLPAGKTVPKQQSEREKMVASLRFKILERDNFTCRACGRNAREDGVKLHVDHITPVAKGGLTVESNLHTLCQDCNLGKSDKVVDQMGLW